MDAREGVPLATLSPGLAHALDAQKQATSAFAGGPAGKDSGTNSHCEPRLADDACVHRVSQGSQMHGGPHFYRILRLCRVSLPAV
jgi:hypothetical protein